MIYVSIDLETTGLDPRRDQVLQIGAAAREAKKPNGTIDTFMALLRYDRIVGAPGALAMNARLIDRIAGGQGEDPAAAWDRFAVWLDDYVVDGKVTAAGKNFAGFDLRFIRRAAPDVAERFHHRTLDPASLWTLSNDRVPPSLTECLDRAGLPTTVTHDAVEDALQVAALLEAGWERMLG